MPLELGLCWSFRCPHAACSSIDERRCLLQGEQISVSGTSFTFLTRHGILTPEILGICVHAPKPASASQAEQCRRGSGKFHGIWVAHSSGCHLLQDCMSEEANLQTQMRVDTWMKEELRHLLKDWQWFDGQVRHVPSLRM